MASELHLGDSNWKLFQVGYPVDTSTDMSFLLRVSVTHRPALARSILGRWKERSSDETSVLANCTRNIQTDQRNQKHILTHWHPVQKWKQRRKTSFTRNPPEKEREINKRGKKYKQILNKNEFRTKAEKEKGKEMEKRTKRIDMANTEKRKEKQEKRYNYWTTNQYLCLV